jgi:hypothetical protein
MAGTLHRAAMRKPEMRADVLKQFDRVFNGVLLVFRQAVPPFLELAGILDFPHNSSIFHKRNTVKRLFEIFHVSVSWAVLPEKKLKVGTFLLIIPYTGYIFFIVSSFKDYPLWLRYFGPR